MQKPQLLLKLEIILNVARTIGYAIFSFKNLTVDL